MIMDIQPVSEDFIIIIVIKIIGTIIIPTGIGTLMIPGIGASVFIGDITGYGLPGVHIIITGIPGIHLDGVSVLDMDMDGDILFPTGDILTMAIMAGEAITGMVIGEETISITVMTTTLIMVPVNPGRVIVEGKVIT